MPDPADEQRERRRTDRGERSDEVAAEARVDLAEERQRQVQLILVLPADPGIVVRRREQRLAHGRGRAKGDEQARHDAGSRARSGPVIVSLGERDAIPCVW